MQAVIDGVLFELKSPFDFSFLRHYGRVFKVFDQQESGNICFGVEGSNGKFFVKFAGAPTVRAVQTPRDAVTHAKESVAIYRDLYHEHLLNLISWKEVGGGIALVFPWMETICWGKRYPEQHLQFCALPLDEKLSIFDAILKFHCHVLACGYVPIDFYDGCVLYDPHTQKTYICDIEFYKKQPYYNKVGRLWGSSRFMSPEEFTYGMPIDERTCVFGMGATALELFGSGKKWGDAGWQLTAPLYQVVARAVESDRAARWQTLDAFCEAWRAATRLERL